MVEDYTTDKVVISFNGLFDTKALISFGSFLCDMQGCSKLQLREKSDDCESISIIDFNDLEDVANDILEDNRVYFNEDK